ncbi:MAG TPA: ABC transporter substrate-binding protein [Actinocrinis sp.]|nr:ABC transporter substrate-binding protein [Actinocrinis sp.]
MSLSRRTRVVAAIAALVAASTAMVGCSAKSTKSPSAAAATGTPVQGGTVRYAEYEGGYPNAIWPFMLPSQDTTTNVGQLQYLLYRPLYFWGTDNKVALDQNTSIGQLPTWSADGKTVTITLKSYKWSNGDAVTAQDALFWINMEKTEGPLGNLAYYTPPNTSLDAQYFPDNIVTATASGQTLTLTLNKTYNKTWFLDDELSQITPMPLEWDETAAGTAGTCATATFGTPAMTTACTADWKYLSAQSTLGGTWTTSPLWTIIDGAWKLKSYNGSSGAYSIVPNPSYSGPDKPHLDEVDFVPYKSDTAEYAALKAGGTDALNIGYLTQSAQPEFVPSNPDSDNPLTSKGYVFAPLADQDGIQYYQINFGNTDVGQLFKQGYFTKAVQETVDQAGMIKSVQKGWGYPSSGAVPPQPAGNPILPSANTANVFDIAAAKASLTAHGWDTSQTPATCTDPGTGPNQCGAGIAQGQKAAYTVDYTAGNSGAQLETELEASDAAKAGIQITFTAQQENQIGAEGVTCAGSTASGCWQGLFYGGWVYAPDYLPTGEALFATGAGPNTWSYSNPQVDQTAYQSTVSNSASAMDAYETALAALPPVIFQPNGQGNVGYPFIPEVSKNLYVGKSDPFGGFQPQDWYFTK